VTLLPCGLWQNGLLQEVYYTFGTCKLDWQLEPRSTRYKDLTSIITINIIFNFWGKNKKDARKRNNVVYSASEQT